MTDFIRVAGGEVVGEPGPLPQRIRLPDGSQRTDLPGQLAEGHVTLADLRGWGLYPVTTAAPSIDPDTHRLVETSRAVRDLDVLITYVAEPIPTAETSLADYKAARRLAVNAARWRHETGGMLFGAVPIRTDEASQSKIQGAAALFDKDPTLDVVDFEAQPGVWVALDQETFETLGVAVGRHVQRCFSRAKVLHGMIDSAPDKAAVDMVDIESGWPA